MSQSIAEVYQQALERYQAGASPEELIPVFEEICQQEPRLTPTWSSLAWLYLLTDQPHKALKAAQQGVRFDARAPQARLNLALAMLATGKSGVREHIEAAQRMMSLDKDVRKDIEENIADGLKRKPDWEHLSRVKKWLM